MTVEVGRHDSTLGRGMRIDLTVRNAGPHVVAADDVRVVVSARVPDLVVEHGWQSWSVVRRCRPDDVRPERAGAPDSVRDALVADGGRAGRGVGGDQFLVHTGGVVGWLDGRAQLGTVEAGSDGLVAVALLDGVELAPGEERALDPLWIAEGDPGELYAEYAGHWASVANARPAAEATVGWCSWYHYFAAVTPDDVRANLPLAVRYHLPLVQVDDGYQAAIGDWLRPCPAWRGGIAAIADEIRDAGGAPGLWTAPFLAGANSELYRDHPDWVVRGANGEPVLAMWNDVNWGGATYALDTTRPDVLDHLRTMFAALVDAGFDYHKIDFCYAAALPGVRADAAVTRAQALRAGLAAVRDGIGDRFLLGCGCPFGAAVGLVDAMRVSADVAPTWEPLEHWPGFRESAPAAVNAIEASVLRAPLDGRVWANDPDCVLLRPTATGLDEAQRAALADAVVAAGTFLVVSDDLALYGHDEWRGLGELRGRLTDGPRVLPDPFASGPPRARYLQSS